MKKSNYISILLALILIISCYVPAFAAGAFSIDITLDGAAVSSVEKDGTITVTVKSPAVSLADSEGGVKYVLSFDKSIFQLVDGTVKTAVPGTVISLDVSDTAFANAYGTVEVNSSNVQSGMASGNLVISADFTAVSEGSGTFVFSIEEMYDMNGGEHINGYGVPSPVSINVYSQSEGGGEVVPDPDPATETEPITDPDPAPTGGPEQDPGTDPVPTSDPEQDPGTDPAPTGDPEQEPAIDPNPVPADSEQNPSIEPASSSGTDTSSGTAPSSGSDTTAGPAPDTEQPAASDQPQPPAKDFEDVPATAFFKDAVDWAVANGITDGTSETRFTPYAPATRAQIVTFLWRAAGCPETDAATTGFADVPAGSYYEKAVRWAYASGITDGVSSTRFAPEKIVSRAQAVTFLCRFAKAKAAGQNPFSDVKAGSYYEGAVSWAYENGITDGTSAGRFSPDDDVNRAQAVTFLFRYFKDLTE